MKESYWGYWLILLGIFIIVILMLVQNYTSTNTQDYYTVKEVTEAAMIDAVDYTTYRSSGVLTINTEKFKESFIRRFSETVNLSTTYTIDFYQLSANPPKVTVVVKSKSSETSVSWDSDDLDEAFDTINRVDAILEQTEAKGNCKDDPTYVTKETCDDKYGEGTWVSYEGVCNSIITGAKTKKECSSGEWNSDIGICQIKGTKTKDGCTEKGYAWTDYETNQITYGKCDGKPYIAKEKCEGTWEAVSDDIADTSK